MNNNKIPNIHLASQTKMRVDNLKLRISTLQNIITSKLKSINGLIFRNKGRGLIGLMLKLIRGIRPRASKSVVRQVSMFSFRCYRIAKHSGLKGLVIYLKACQVLLQQSVGGYRVLDLSELKVRPKRNRSGVPLIIPAGIRALISQKRCPSSIKLWMTLLGLYRVLEFRGKLSLNTITDTGPDLRAFLPIWREFIENEFKPNLFNIIDIPEYKPSKISPILKSGPISKIEPDNRFEASFTNSSAKALIMGARTFLKKGNETLLTALVNISNQTRGGSTLLSRLKMMALATHKELDLWLFTESGIRPLGRLGFKPEPAGKIRVFAMVDAWTQWILKPLHKWLFQILDQIPQDGTFDQLSPISRLQSIYSDNLKGQISSIDLSAATDRLPIDLQVIILEVLLKDIVPDSALFAKSWSDLLIKRDYLVVTDPKQTEFDLPSEIILSNNLKETKTVTYSVGQPMGALSSWAMLAITHHAMMQFAASRSGRSGWFEDYAVLGDDGVIKGKNPSDSYLSLLKTIGVKAGLAKSILAKNRFVIEFAKKFFVDQTQANMLPIKECVATWASTSLVCEFVRKYDLSLNAILSFLGYGYKSKMRVYKTLYFNLPTRLRVLLVWLSHPSSPLGKEYYVDWLTQKSWTEGHQPSESALRLVLEKLEDKNKLKLDSISAAFDKYTDSLANIDKSLDQVYPLSIYTMNSRTENTFQVPVPWKAVLSPDLDPEDLDYEKLSRMNVGGTDSFGGVQAADHWTSSHWRLRELDVGIDVEDLVEEFRTKLATEGGDLYADTGPLYEGPCWGGYHLLEVEDKIDIQCQYFFQLDELKASVPEKFWNEDRSPEKPFRDFLSIYKFWQDVTKPLWSEFYGKDVSETSSPVKPVTSIARGDTEGLVQHHSPLGSLKIPEWVEFLIGVLISFLILEFTLGNSEPLIHVPFSYDVLSSESEILNDGFWRDTPIPLWGIACFSVGLFLICGTLVSSIYHGSFYDLSWYFIPRDSPEILIHPPLQPALQLDTVMVGVGRISGPISSNSLRLIQTYLENQALLDNLAISPIGALWELPIV